MISTQSSGEGSSLELPLPSQFDSIEDILRMPTERLKKGPLVSLIGLIKDFQPPIPTNGTDFKCTLTIVDLSTQVEYGDQGKGLKVVIFWPEERMPRISGVRDAVVLRKFKVQMWDGTVSLLGNWASAIHVFPAAQMSSSLMPKPVPSKNAAPSLAETKYAMWLFYNLDKNLFPDPQIFHENSTVALNRGEKYSILKDIKADCFYDLIGEVISIYERDGRVTLYLSDYSANSLFYDNKWNDETNDSSSRDGDEYGYTKSRKKTTSDWPGPFGKLSIQITAYDNHAAFIAEHVKVKNWVILKNVQVKMGNQGGCLEGFLRGDRGGWDAWEGKVHVKVIEKAEDAEKNDIRWKDALRRRKEYWARYDKQKQKFLQEVQGSHGKRNLGDMEVSKPNSKKRRQEERAAAEQKVLDIEKRAKERLDLNLHVKCNYPDVIRTPLSTILNGSHSTWLVSGTECILPFQNIKHRSDVRVIDFWPNRIEDFVVARRASDYDVLSDYSGGESTDDEEDMHLFRQGKGYGGEKTWEWRFALRVRDANKKAGNDDHTMWLIVDNSSAQMLLGMDAVNLRQDEETLAELHEVLFKLWGDLAEKKAAYMSDRNQKALKATEISAKSKAMVKTSSTSSVQPGDDLPPDSDDDEAISKSRKTESLSKIASREDEKRNDNKTNTADDEKPNADLSETIASLPFTNKGFTCCIQQYGIKVPEKLSSKANAGNGLRWKRVFGLFGTKIT